MSTHGFPAYPDIPPEERERQQREAAAEKAARAERLREWKRKYKAA